MVDADDAYVLDLADFGDLDDSFATEIVSRIVTSCATNVKIAAINSENVGAPTHLVCAGSGETCEVSGEKTGIISGEKQCLYLFRGMLFALIRHVFLGQNKEGKQNMLPLSQELDEEKD